MILGTETPSLSVVIPVFNEAENIGRVLEEFRAKVHTLHELIVVYDVDEDTTVSVVRDLLAEMPSVRLHRNRRGRGVLNAMLSGIEAARAPLVLVSMADGSDDLRQVDGMVALGESGADLVAASRYMRGGRHVGGPRLKRLLSRAAGLSLHRLGRVPIHDATNNFKLNRREFLESVKIESSGGFELAIELTVKATLDGRQLAELPTTWRDRTAGQTRFRLLAWLPLYLRWYLHLFRGRLLARGR